MYPIIFFLLLTAQIPYQFKTEQNIDRAYINAKKGIYWGLSQSPAKQNLIKNDLIDNDKLISAVRVEKEVNGVQVESTGYYEGCEVKIMIYKSKDNLIKEGFLLPDSLIKKSSIRRQKKST